MMKGFAPVAPLPVHKELDEHGLLGDYHLLLPHTIRQDEEAHAEFWQPRKGQTIIMDNSLVELGYPLPIPQVVRAARVVGATIVVLPDFLGNADQTVSAARRTIDQVPPEFHSLGVVQGTNYMEAMGCAEALVELGCQVLSIPRHLTKKIGSRIQIVGEVYANFRVPIHLLGFSDNVYDDIQAASREGVMGIDSAVPIWYGQAGVELSFKSPSKLLRRPAEYWETGQVTLEVLNNMRTVRAWLSVVPDAHTPEELLGLAGIRKQASASSEKHPDKTN